MLGQLSIEGRIFLSKRNSIPSIFNFQCGKLGLLTEEEYFSDPSIGFISSSKSNSRDLDQVFWLGETPGKSKPSLTPGLKKPKILKLIVLVDSLYLEIVEGSGAKNFIGQRKHFDVHYVQVLDSHSLYYRRYDSSKLEL